MTADIGVIAVIVVAVMALAWALAARRERHARTRMKVTTECCAPDEFGVFVRNGIVFCRVNGGGQQQRDEVVTALHRETHA